MLVKNTPLLGRFLPPGRENGTVKEEKRKKERNVGARGAKRSLR